MTSQPHPAAPDQPSNGASALSQTVIRLLGGEVLADINEIEQDRLEAKFDLACDLVDREDFDGAIDTLAMLAINDPYDFRFQFGFGLCLQQLGRIEDAARAFALASLLDPDDAGCVFRAGECCAALNDREGAELAFREAIDLCEPPTPNPEIRLACEAALARINA